MLSSTTTKASVKQLLKELFDVIVELSAGPEGDLCAENLQKAIQILKNPDKIPMPSVPNSSTIPSESLPASPSMAKTPDTFMDYSSFAPGHAPQMNVLIFGSMGFINYQLKSLLAKMRSDVTILDNTEEALETFKNNDFTAVIIDVTSPNEHEGFEFLDEIKKLCILGSLSTRLICISGVAQNRNALSQSAKVRGAHELVIREEGWHKHLMDVLR